MDSVDVKNRVESNLDAQCFVSEFSGGSDHYSIVVVSKEFEGKSQLKRHRMVMELFKNEVDSGELHALSIRALTPDQWEG